MADTLLLDTCALLWLASGGLHKDPADRFIIASALKNGFMVVTADSNFGKYGVKTVC